MASWILPKNKRNSLVLNTKDSELRSFFGRIEDTMFYFQDFLCSIKGLIFYSLLHTKTFQITYIRYKKIKTFIKLLIGLSAYMFQLHQIPPLFRSQGHSINLKKTNSVISFIRFDLIFHCLLFGLYIRVKNVWGG